MNNKPNYITIDDWIAERKATAIYEPIGQVELPGRMLEISDTNKRESEKQAHLNLALMGLVSRMRAVKAKETIIQHVMDCRVASITVDGKTNSRNMLLEGKGRQAVVEEKKRSGLMGLFGGDKK